MREMSFKCGNEIFFVRSQVYGEQNKQVLVHFFNRNLDDEKHFSIILPEHEEDQLYNCTAGEVAQCLVFLTEHVEEIIKMAFEQMAQENQRYQDYVDSMSDSNNVFLARPLSEDMKELRTFLKHQGVRWKDASDTYGVIDPVNRTEFNFCGYKYCIEQRDNTNKLRLIINGIEFDDTVFMEDIIKCMNTMYNED